MTSRQFFSDVQKNVSRQIMFTKPPLFILPSVPKYNTIQYLSTLLTIWIFVISIVCIVVYWFWLNRQNKATLLKFFRIFCLLECVQCTCWHLYSSKTSQQYSDTTTKYTEGLGILGRMQTMVDIIHHVSLLLSSYIVKITQFWWWKLVNI